MSERQANLPSWVNRLLAACVAIVLTSGMLKPVVAQEQLTYNATGPSLSLQDTSFNLSQLEELLRDTSAIDFWTKLRLKFKLDEILKSVVRNDEGFGEHNIAALKVRFFALVDETASKLKGGDPRLSQWVAASREEIWEALLRR